MFAQLGNIVFEGLLGFDSFTSSQETNFVQHSKIEKKPRLQQIGEKLGEYSISVRMNISFCNPVAQIEALNENRRNGEILALIRGDGSLVGTFVIVNVSTSEEQQSDIGTIVQVGVTITLLEAETDDPEVLEQQEAVRSGFAMSKNNPTTLFFRKKEQGEALAFMNSVRSGSTSASSAVETSKDAKKDVNKRAQFLKKVQRKLKSAREAFQKADKQLTDAKHVYQSAQKMKQAFADTQSAITNSLEAAQGGDIDSLITANSELSRATGRTNGATAEAAVFAGTRKP